MSASFIASMPPIRCSASRRMSIVPPAAAATRDRGSFTLANGYSIWKKYTKAGTSAPFGETLTIQAHHLTHQFHARLGRPRLEQPRDEGREVPAIVHDVGIGEEQDRCAACRDALMQGPHFSGPARGFGLAANDLEIRCRCRRAPPYHRSTRRRPGRCGTYPRNPAPGARRSPPR